MTTINEVKSDQLIEKTAEELKKLPELKQPIWAMFVKTGMHKERTPLRKDWWYIRAAAVLRKISLMGPIGVNKLRTKYGGRKNRGHKPSHFYKSSGNIIRKIMQGLEKAGLIKKVEKGVHKGKVLTIKGNSLLTGVVSQITGKPIERKAKRKVGPPEKKSTKKKKTARKPKVKKETTKKIVKKSSKKEKSQSEEKKTEEKTKVKTELKPETKKE